MISQARPRVLITRSLLPEAMAYLEEHVEAIIGASDRYLSKDEIIAGVEDKVGLLSLLVDKIDRDVMDAATGLKIIANCAVGYNNIDVDYARKKGIMVTNTPGVLTETTADLTWGLILATARRIPQAEAFARRGEFTGWELDLFLGKEVAGQQLGIVGMGRIGKAVALRARGFCMKTVYFDPHRLDPQAEKTYAAAFMPLVKLLATSDIVTLHTSLNPQTVHLIGEDELARMKPSALLINVSRGPVVDEAALAAALKSGQIWGAGLDVYEQEPEIHPLLRELPNVVLLPHIGSASYATRLKMAMMAARNLVQGVSGLTPENLI